MTGGMGRLSFDYTTKIRPYTMHTSLVSHASKVLSKIILERIREKTETEIVGEQASFSQKKVKRSGAGQLGLAVWVPRC